MAYAAQVQHEHGLRPEVSSSQHAEYAMQGHEVSNLMATSDEAAYSNFTYWVPAPPPPSPHQSGANSFLDATSSDQPDPISVCDC